MTLPPRTGGGPEFDGSTPFVMGSVIGARSFRVTDKGELTGVVFPRVWEEGVNLADCRALIGWNVPGVGLVHRVWRRFIDAPGEPIRMGSSVYRPRVHAGWYWVAEDGREGLVMEKPPEAYLDWDSPAHDFEGCTCGWYGYYQGSLNYANSDGISGIVEGFGLVRRGTRGFRAQKARIKALYVPHKVEGPRHYQPVDKSLPYMSALARAGEFNPTPDEMRERVAERYPNVPMFSNLGDMIAEFPTDPGEEPS